MKKDSLYDAVANHDFSEKRCFLCGCGLTDGNHSKEHIFPKWLLNHFSLWNTKVTLLNKTEIPYKDLVIPCCEDCNGTHLSKIEAEVKRNFLDDSSNLEKMDRRTLFIWTLKIFFGLLYRELFLTFDRKDPAAGTIVSPKDMEQYRLLHFILQSSRVPMNFTNMDSDIPGSLFVFNLKEPRNPVLKFDYKDDISSRSLYLRLGNVGILVAYDMGAQTVEGRDFFSHYQKILLHPLQFEELGANFFLKASKFDRVPKVAIGESDTGISFMVMPIAGFSMKPVFGDWSHEEKILMLMNFLGYPREAISPVEGKIMTWLRNSVGEIQTIEIDQPPWSGVPSAE